MVISPKKIALYFNSNGAGTTQAQANMVQIEDDWRNTNDTRDAPPEENLKHTRRMQSATRILKSLRHSSVARAMGRGAQCYVVLSSVFFFAPCCNLLYTISVCMVVRALIYRKLRNRAKKKTLSDTI